MKTMPCCRRAGEEGFTLVEALVSTSLVVLVMGLTLGSFLFGVRMMYKDNVRLETNASLRYFTAHVAKETLDSSEFYLFPSYQTLDGNVDLVADVSPLQPDSYGTTIAHGDCVVLVTRTAVTSGADVRQFRIYYRQATAAARNNEASIRFFKSADWGVGGTPASLTALLNAVNLNANPVLAGSTEVTARAKGRKITGSTNSYPIFCSESPTVSATNESFSINVEFINGTSVTNLLSSSSFNYTVSPRR
jgi:hypothetical protein